MNIALISSSLGIIHSKIVSLKSIDSSSTINAGSLFIFNSVFSVSSFVSSILIKSDNPSSSNALITFVFSSLVFSTLQYIFTFIFLYVII
ncbi:hypothetical protein GW891_03545 [bacterium]|nr:hypothetical protein [bacterium]